MLGIGVTTRNRNELVAYGIQRIRAFSPECKLVVIDDFSDQAVPGAIHSQCRLGVSGAKNACLWQLQDCDPIVLFDDDCWPQCEGWDSFLQGAAQAAGVHHLMLMPTYELTVRETGFHILEERQCGDYRLRLMDNATGVMLYLDQTVIQKVGGFNSLPGPYGFEHVAYTWRINRAGLMADLGPYLTVTGLSDYLFSVDLDGIPPDYTGPVQSSMSQAEIRLSIASNTGPYQAAQAGAIFVPLSNPLGVS